MTYPRPPVAGQHAAALLMRIRGDLTEQVERVDALVAGLEGDDGPEDVA